MLILVGVSSELLQVLSWILEVLPWSLGSDIKTAPGIGAPPVAQAVVVVVGVGIKVVLVSIQRQVVSIVEITWLQDLRKRAGGAKSIQRVDGEKRHSDAPEPEEWKLLMLSSDDVSHKEATESSQEASLIGGLVEFFAVIAR